MKRSSRIAKFAVLCAVLASQPCSVAPLRADSPDAAAHRPAPSADVRYPADAGVFNVRDPRFGAVGDGVHDDTDAIQAALAAAPMAAQRIVYLPNGTYRVTRTLNWVGDSQRYTTLQGQSVAGVVIKLDDNAAPFGDAKSPRAVVSTRRDRDGLLNSFGNGVRNLTVDVGAGNSGAVGIDFISNNGGGVADVRIRSSDLSGAGAVGLLIAQQCSGPALYERVQVDGFDVGIRTEKPAFNEVFNHLTLSGQRVAGISNDEHVLTIRDLRSTNRVPAIVQHGEYAALYLIDSHLEGGDADAPAIRATGSDKSCGQVYIRDVATNGYARALDVERKAISPATNGVARVDEYTSKPWVTATSADRAASLRLPIQDVPTVPTDDPATWASITAARGPTPGAVANASGKPFARAWRENEQWWSPDGDAAPAIQAAIDSGAMTIYFPSGIYSLASTIHIRGNVRRIVGCGSMIQVTHAFSETGEPAFVFEKGTAPVVVIEDLMADYGRMKGAYIVHDSDRTLVLSEVGTIGPGSGMQPPSATRGTEWSYLTGPNGTGDAYFLRFNGFTKLVRQKAWFFSFNPEGGKADKLGELVVNDGGTVAIVGMKTEGVSTFVHTLNGGRTEVIGGILGTTDYTPPKLPIVLTQDAAASVLATTFIDPAATPTLIARTRRDGRWIDRLNDAFAVKSVTPQWNHSTNSNMPAGTWITFTTGATTQNAEK
jgi:hypothetical protein